MSMNLALGLALGQKLAESRGVESVEARRRAGVLLGVMGSTPASFVATKVVIDQQLRLEQNNRGDKGDKGDDVAGAGDAGPDVIDDAAFAALVEETVHAEFEKAVPLIQAEVGTIGAKLDPKALAMVLGPIIRDAVVEGMKQAQAAAATASPGNKQP
ncbi:hypothetical protein [Tropicimonas sp. IMCC34043]|uniref:hypothetical protein n=1 Tax=Tropicimonas sp. IMCC34043 TaxID=2248760 RepID=UPI001300B05E|nr:hypothetical protein [Tropicimonas sp. IMCC34043]